MGCAYFYKFEDSVITCFVVQNICIVLPLATFRSNLIVSAKFYTISDVGAYMLKTYNV